MTSTQMKSTTVATAKASDKWRAVLSGELRDKAMAAVLEIADHLPKPADIFSFSDSAEIALFYAYLAKVAERDDYASRAFDYLNDSINLVPENLNSPWLHGGFVGVGWSIAHLEGILFGKEETESCAVVDEILKNRLSAKKSPQLYDVIGGLAGLGVYALERLPEKSAIEVLGRVLAHLEDTAEHNQQGITWFTPPQHLPPWQEQMCPNGYYNLGVGHGVPGVIAMLAQASAVEDVAAQAKRLLAGAASWLLANKSYDDKGAYFPCWQAAEIEPELSRQAWCYGELGAAASLLFAARCVGNQNWEDEALAILRRSALRRLEDSGVRDASLCHGAAGNAHIFNRIHQATGEEVFKDAALYWYERTFDFKEPGQGIAGFRIWGTTEDGGEGWTIRSGFLDGAAGIGLALLAAVTAVEPRWDRLMLVSLSPR